MSVEVDGRGYEMRLHTTEPPVGELARRRNGRQAALAVGAPGAVYTPMQGTVLAVEVIDGDAVEGGQVLFVVEAMEDGERDRPARSGVVGAVTVVPGDAVSRGAPLRDRRPNG